MAAGKPVLLPLVGLAQEPPAGTGVAGVVWLDFIRGGGGRRGVPDPGEHGRCPAPTSGWPHRSGGPRSTTTPSRCPCPDYAIEMAVSRLRRTLPVTDLIQTVMRHGYRLVA
ncbi:MAG TPA: hypothetical protein VJT31_23620 [Rugosimonospora sp.]|nr:hypothetical protein [Rugosimonospora sp.]